MGIIVFPALFCRVSLADITAGFLTVGSSLFQHKLSLSHFLRWFFQKPSIGLLKPVKSHCTASRQHLSSGIYVLGTRCFPVFKSISSLKRVFLKHRYEIIACSRVFTANIVRIREVVQGVYGMVHKQKKLRILVYGHKHFAFLNQENKQVRYSL